jgi:hypothetical protein
VNITPNVAPCDRLALYATKDGSRTKDQPVRAGASVPMRFTQDGAEFVLLAVITPQGDETADAAILREVRELDAEIAALLEDVA